MPAIIDPNAIYSIEEVKSMLGVTTRRLGQAALDGTLKSSRKGRDRFFRGQWLLDWIDTPSDAPKPSMKPTGTAKPTGAAIPHAKQTGGTIPTATPSRATSPQARPTGTAIPTGAARTT